MTHEEAWIALAKVLGTRSHLLHPLLRRFGTPEAILSADANALRDALPDMSDVLLAAILNKQVYQDAASIAAWCHRNHVQILTFDGAEYPSRLREIDDPPAVLYCRGRLPALEHRLAVGVVGCRKLDAYGQQTAYKLSFELASTGAVIVSGLADGIDAVAAAAALNAGGDTVAVLGCGIDLIYPKKNGRLGEAVAERGAILTEYPPGTRPYAWNFPARNRIISALSHAVLVVEAGLQSGSLITARYAAVQGRAVFAVPGDVTSERSSGTNDLLCKGAFPAIGAEQMLHRLRPLVQDDVPFGTAPEANDRSVLTAEALQRYGLQLILSAPDKAEALPRTRAKAVKLPQKEETAEAAQEPVASKAEPDTSPLSPRQKQLFALLPSGSFSVDVLTTAGTPVSEAVSTLTIFEIYGLIRSIPGGMFEKI